MLDVAGVEAELLTSGNYVAINVFDAKRSLPWATAPRSLSPAVRTGDCYTVAAGPEFAKRRCKEPPDSRGRNNRRHDQNSQRKIGTGQIQEVTARATRSMSIERDTSERGRCRHKAVTSVFGRRDGGHPGALSALSLVFLLATCALCELRAETRKARIVGLAPRPVSGSMTT